MKFSDRYLQSLKPQAKEYTINEGRGFVILVLPSSSKTFYIRYTFDGKQKKHKIGQYPYTSLADAREEYNECVKKIKNGIDPAVKVVEVKKVEEVVEELTVEWMTKKFLEWSECYHSRAWHRNCELTIGKHLPNDWKPRLVTDIKKRDAITLMESIAKGGGGAARNAQRVIRGIFAYAEARNHIEASPLVKLSRAVPALKSVSGKRTLSPKEIKHVWDSLYSPNCSPGKRAILLILVTGQRPEECAEIVSTEIDGDWWTLPPERNKKKRYHTVFLTETAKMLIGKAEGIIFTGRSRSEPVKRASLSKGIAAVNYLGLPRWTPHDLRRTVKTHMARLGIPKEHSEAVVNHSKDGMEAVYNLYEYDAEKKIALLTWEAELLRLIK